MRSALISVAILLFQAFQTNQSSQTNQSNQTDRSSYDRSDEVDAAPAHFRYERVLQVPPGTQGQACAVIDAAVYAHSSGRLSDLRIYSDEHEVPFVRTESREAGQQEEPARLLNLGRRGAAIVFDLAMPARPYTAVVLDLDGRDFYATAKISGAQQAGTPGTQLAEVVLFDLKSQGLSRSTTLALQESSFPVLHVEMKVTPAPGGDATLLTQAMVHGAVVPPSREAQTLYATVASTDQIVTRGRQSIASFKVPAHVPVERVTFVLQPGSTKNFSREVRVSARSPQTQESGAEETVSGEIQRVRLPVDAFGQEIRSEQLSVEALLAANVRGDAVVTVAVENGDDTPLPLRAVQLQMRQRTLCFDAAPGAGYVLRYGDASPVRSPVYDYARLFKASATHATVALAAERPNPQFREDVIQRPYTDRHPEVLWVALLLVIGVLGTVALHNARRVGRRK